MEVMAADQAQQKAKCKQAIDRLESGSPNTSFFYFGGKLYAT